MRRRRDVLRAYAEWAISIPVGMALLVGLAAALTIADMPWRREDGTWVL